MPISQHRMAALINAALDYRQALEKLCESILEAVDSPGNKEDLIYQLSLLANPNVLLNNSAESASTLTVEYHHFRRHFKENERRALKMAVKRLEAGVVPRAITPRTEYIKPTKSLPTNLSHQIPKFKGLSIEQKIQIDAEIALQEYEHQNKEPEKEDQECPHCAAQDIDDCPNRINCPWAEELANQQGDE